jgi:hypothetical protein
MIDTAETERLDNTCLYILCGAGLVELCFRGRAWSDQKALDVEVAATGVWIDEDRNSILPDEVRKAVPAWHGRAIAVEMYTVLQARLTSFGQEQQQGLSDGPQDAGLFLAFLCANPVKGRVAVRLLGNEGPAPGAVQQDVVNGNIIAALKDIATSIRELKGVPPTGAPPIQIPQEKAPALQWPANMIIFQSNGVYLVGGETLRVTESEDNVLQAFLEQPAMTKDELASAVSF